MKRKIVTVLVIVICFLLQCTVFHALAFGSIRPNLLIIATSAFGFMRGKKTGMLVGFLSGIMADVFWGSSLGLYALIYTLIGYLNGCFRRLFFDDDIKLPLALIAASEMIYGTFIYFCIFMLQGEFNFLFYLAHIILPELIYTILVTLVLYQVILHINRGLETEEQRSASKFV